MRAPFPRVVLSAALQARSRRNPLLPRIAPPPSNGRTAEAPDDWLARGRHRGCHRTCSPGSLPGYVGVGGGFIMVPLMMSILHVPMKLTSGTSLIAVMILAVPGTITQAVARQHQLGCRHRCGLRFHPRRGPGRQAHPEGARAPAALSVRRLPRGGRRSARRQPAGGLGLGRFRWHSQVCYTGVN